jgi:hypothetical protein
VYNHESLGAIQDIKNSIVIQLERTLKDLGIQEQLVLEKWNKDLVFQEMMIQKLKEQLLLSQQHAKEDPIFGRMREYVSSELERAVNVYYVAPTATELTSAFSRPLDLIEKREDLSHRRAISESVQTSEALKGLPPLPKPSDNRHKRSSTMLSFEAFQARFPKFSRNRRASESTASTGTSPASPSPLDSPIESPA